MQQETLIKKITLFALMTFILAAGSVSAAAEKVQIAPGVKKPLVAFYSRTGNARMLATALAAHLEADLEEIGSEKDRGIFTIIGEQYFWGDDKQKPFEKNLQDYSPIIVVAPIYLMKLSAPGRFFIAEVIPEGSEVYVFTTSGGPLAGSTQKDIMELVVDSGLIAKGVYGFQAGKTQEEFDNATRDFLAEQPLISQAPEEAEQPQEADNDTEEDEKCEKQ